uniref:Uncharacterized protein n=1 Tax=Arundo donax TaxID=35708 RepID=A0A0A9T7G1_ARUDO
MKTSTVLEQLSGNFLEKLGDSSYYLCLMIFVVPLVYFLKKRMKAICKL